VFSNDPSVKKLGCVPELKVEYFIVSIYMLASHLLKYYVNDKKTRELFRSFTYDFHKRWKSYDERTDTEMMSFAVHRQQGEADVAYREQIIRLSFFQWLEVNDEEIILKDSNRAFSEAQRIKIFRDGNGLCGACLRDGLSAKESAVSWRNFHADHVVPHSKGGQTDLENAELLCSAHNLAKSNH
jgi:hypothetical protein